MSNVRQCLNNAVIFNVEFRNLVQRWSSLWKCSGIQNRHNNWRYAKSNQIFRYLLQFIHSHQLYFLYYHLFLSPMRPWRWVAINHSWSQILSNCMYGKIHFCDIKHLTWEYYQSLSDQSLCTAAWIILTADQMK